jgi:hypothetical protein
MAETRKPKPGDVIWADRIAYSHCGIYEGGGYVIHFAAPEGSEISQENAFIHRTRLDNFANGGPVKIVDFPEGYSSEETLRRARSRIGEKGYNFFTNNCDHFATWCKTGVHHSLQVDDAKNIIRMVGEIAGGPVGAAGEIICTVHDVAEDFEAQKLASIDRIQKPQGIQDRLDLNTTITGYIPPESKEIPAEEIPFPYEPKELPLLTDPPLEYDKNEPEMEDSDGDARPKKPPLYERIGEKLKSWTYPIAGALETLKRLDKLPFFMKNIDYNILGAKVRNGIDKVVTAIKVFTGKLTPQQGIEENKTNETALLGQQIAQKQKHPIGEVVKQVFGKVGTVIKHVAQQAINVFVPAPLRPMIKAGARMLGKAVVGGLKAVGNALKTGVSKFVSLFRGGKK